MTSDTYNPKAGVIIPGGIGGFLMPPGHPDHGSRVQTQLRRRRDDRDEYAVSSVASGEYDLAPELIERAKALVQAWEREKAPLTARETRLWVLRVNAHFKGCYDLSGSARTTDDYHYCYRTPTPDAYGDGILNPPGVPLWRRKVPTTTRLWGPSELRLVMDPGKPLGADGWCDQEHRPEQLVAVRFIRRFYPEYQFSDLDLEPDCADCGHHVNAHDNGEGGVCAVILDNPRYKASIDAGVPHGSPAVDGLCRCPIFKVREAA